jgi:hypothetical protein
MRNLGRTQRRSHRDSEFSLSNSIGCTTVGTTSRFHSRTIVGRLVCEHRCRVSFDGVIKLPNAKAALVFLLLPATVVTACDDDSSPAAAPINLPTPSVNLTDGGGAQEHPPNVDPPKGTGVRIVVKHATHFNALFGDPSPNIRVLFQGADGKILSETKTDANGKASAAVAPKYVTVLADTGFRTYADVEEGDELFIADDASVPDLPMHPLPDLGSYSANLSGLASLSGEAWEISFGGDCIAQPNDLTAPVLIKVRPSCYFEGPPHGALIATLFQNDQFIEGFVWNKEVPLVKKGETLSTGAAPTLVAPHTGTISVAPNLPHAQVGQAWIHTYVNEREFVFHQDGNVVPEGGGGGGVIIQYPWVSDDMAIKVDVVFDNDYSNHRTYMKRADRSKPGTAVVPDFTMEISADNFLPALKTADVKQENGRPVLSWSSIDAPTTGDAFLTRVHAKIAFPETSVRDVIWVVIAKPTSSPLLMPDLPADLKPRPDLMVEDSRACAVVDRGIGYKAFKSLPFDFNFKFARGMLPKESRIRISGAGTLY